MIKEKIIVRNASGLHARPANAFVKTAAPFRCKVLIEKDGRSFNAKSIVSVLSACVKADTEITLSADGEDEAACIQALIAAIEAGLGE